MITAEEAKEITLRTYTTDLTIIYQQIREAAENGKLHIRINNNLSTEAIDKLKELGYTTIESGLSDYTWIISWQNKHLTPKI